MSEEWKTIEEGAVIKHDIKKAPITGNWRYMKPTVDKKSCIGCGQCMPFCPEAAIDYDSERKADIDYDFCKGCGVCATVCPKKAIRMGKNT
ncbi:MAG: 4Fe-4S binding protein [Parcubacteria group bacterium]|jgi:2-oxoacid:acceptor oxidoreductase delta subunit (pyruvate/2-ketoisovalerate family)